MTEIADVCEGFALRNSHAMTLIMSEDRLSAALARIDIALARLEAAASRPAVSQGVDKEAVDALMARHMALKTEARAAIADIDNLIADVRGSMV